MVLRRNRVARQGRPGAGRSEAAGGGEVGGLDEGAPQRPIREGGERRGGLGDVAAGPRQGLGQGAAALDQPNRVFEIARALFARFEGAPPEGALFRTAAGEGNQDRQGYLAVAEIIAD